MGFLLWFQWFNPPASGLVFHDRRASAAVKAFNVLEFRKPLSEAFKADNSDFICGIMGAMFAQGLPISIMFMDDPIQGRTLLQ